MGGIDEILRPRKTPPDRRPWLMDVNPNALSPVRIPQQHASDPIPDADLLPTPMATLFCLLSQLQPKCGVPKIGIAENRATHIISPHHFGSTSDNNNYCQMITEA
jgi:hypothetical protein